MSEKAFSGNGGGTATLDAGMARSDEGRMTVRGAVNKTLLLAAVLLATAMFSFINPSSTLMWVGAIGGLITVIVATFKREWSPFLAPIYAALEGLFVGSISSFFEAQFSGIIFNAVSLTMAALFGMLFIYRAGWIKVTDKFRSGVMMATGAIFLVYMLNLVLRLFGVEMPFLHQGGTFGIIFSLGVIVIACLNLLLDFDMFEKGEQYGAPEYMEWFAGMGLIVTLVWLYLEILRLLAILSSND